LTISSRGRINKGSVTILASQSQLRQQLLRSAGFKFATVESGVDERRIESVFGSREPGALVRGLAEAKAQAVGDQYPDDIVIGADTVACLPGGRILHKPRDLQDAVRTAMLQSGKTVTIYTAVVIRRGGRAFRRTTASRVVYESFTEDTVRALFHRHGLVPCSGALGFHTDAPGFTLVRRFAGSYSGAMGLPISFVGDSLNKLNAARDEPGSVSPKDTSTSPMQTRKQVG
jgi:septum formation protein